MPSSCSEVWQAILVKKLDLESNHIRDAMSEDARDLLKVGPPSVAPGVAPTCCLSPLPHGAALHWSQRLSQPGACCHRSVAVAWCCDPLSWT